MTTSEGKCVGCSEWPQACRHREGQEVMNRSDEEKVQTDISDKFSLMAFLMGHSFADTETDGHS